jgi:hypothetical protein
MGCEFTWNFSGPFWFFSLNWYVSVYGIYFVFSTPRVWVWVGVGTSYQRNVGADVGGAVKRPPTIREAKPSALHRPRARACDHRRDQGCQLVAILAVWGCIVPVRAYNTLMGHTQPTQNNNNRPCSLVLARIHFFYLPSMAMVMCMCGLCTVRAHKTHHP